MTEIIITKIIAGMIAVSSLVGFIVDIAMVLWKSLRDAFVNDMMASREKTDNFVSNHFSSMFIVNLILMLLFGFILFAPAKVEKTDDGTTRIEMTYEKDTEGLQ